MRNGELYLSFLQCRLQYPHLSETDRKQLEFRLKNLQKNRIGHQASDFVYVDRKGRKSTLYSTVGEYILLYFNNPDCENCHIATRKLKNLALLTDPRIKVLAVYPDADTAEWTTHTRQIPVQWIDARSFRGEIISKSLYFIQAMPTLYLLDKNKRVILKDCSPEELGADLHQILKR
jgi:peroxiredoxin